jgi:hypothetical protein
MIVHLYKCLTLANLSMYCTVGSMSLYQCFTVEYRKNDVTVYSKSRVTVTVSMSAKRKHLNTTVATLRILFSTSCIFSC